MLSSLNQVVKKSRSIRERYFFRFKTLIPKSEWHDITHIFVTHGDPDHYWHTDRIADTSNAPLFCNRTMVRNIDCPAFFTRKYNPADVEMFKEEVEKTGAKCVILQNRESIDI